MDLDLVRRSIGAEGEMRVWDPTGLRQRADEHWDPGIVYEEGPDWPDAGTFEGADAIIARLDEYSEALGRMETEVEQIAPVGEDRVLVVMRASARSPAGVPIDRRWCYLLTVRDSKLVRWRAEMDPERVRRELGLE